MNNEIDASKITEEVRAGQAMIVDVREQDEWDDAHAKDAVHVSVNRILKGELPTEDTSKKLYLYCASGRRSSIAARQLEKQGFATENIGGLKDWQNAGGSVV